MKRDTSPDNGVLEGKYFDGRTKFYAGVAERLSRTWLPVGYREPDLATTTGAGRRMPTVHSQIQRVDPAVQYPGPLGPDPEDRLGQRTIPLHCLAGRKDRRLKVGMDRLSEATPDLSKRAASGSGCTRKSSQPRRKAENAFQDLPKVRKLKWFLQERNSCNLGLRSHG